MSNYLDAADTDDEGDKGTTIISIEDIAEAQERCAALKVEGNAAFQGSNFEEAVKYYSEALSILKTVNAPKDAIILLNRSAAYISLNRFVPALNDASQAAVIDPKNWKSHWRKGVALMKMSKRMFRTKQAIEAFQLCLECETLPDNKKLEVQNELNASRIRLQQQDDATPPADLSNCVPS